MNFLSSLPWYDHPRSSAALDSFWQSMREQLISDGMAGVPARLNRTQPLPDQWRNPGLLLSQCCGPDLFTESAATVSCLGRPVFSDLDCQSGFYYSHIISSASEVANPAVAINSPTSWSGNMALGQWLAARGSSISRCVISGSHQNSLALLRAGKVDVVAIDAHTWSLLDTSGLSVIGRSELAATPPFISGIEDSRTRKLIAAALEQCIASAGHRIGISELLAATREDYEPIDLSSLLDISGELQGEQLVQRRSVGSC